MRAFYGIFLCNIYMQSLLKSALWKVSGEESRGERGGICIELFVKGSLSRI